MLLRISNAEVFLVYMFNMLLCRHRMNSLAVRHRIMMEVGIYLRARRKQEKLTGFKLVQMRDSILL